MVFTTYFPGGPTFSRGGVQILISIETHITIACDFPRGSGPPIPPSGSVHGQCSILARIDSAEPVRPSLSLENPNANRSVVSMRLAKALIRLRIGAGWSEFLVLAHTHCWKSHIRAHLLVQKMHYSCISGRNCICLI